MVFLNWTETIGVVILTGTTTTTGSLFGTLLAVMILLLTICMMFGIDLEWSALLVLPYTLACGAYYSNFIAPLGAIFIYLALLFTKNWLFR